MRVDQDKRSNALKQIKELINDSRNVLVIHYSCESFYNRKDGSSPKITSIAVGKLNDGQTHSFSIHKEAELQNITLEDIELKYKELEKSMLIDFFNYIEKNNDKTFLHWNMRDESFGFQALEYRLKVLGGKPFIISDDKKKDLARLLVEIYGIGYMGNKDSAGNPVGRLYNLVEKNKITSKDFFKGSEEAKAFEDKKYVLLHRSTLRKIDIFANIIERAYNRELKTNSRYCEIHGGKVRAFFNFWGENIYIKGFIAIFAVIGIYSTVQKIIKSFT